MFQEHMILIKNNFALFNTLKEKPIITQMHIYFVNNIWGSLEHIWYRCCLYVSYMVPLTCLVYKLPFPFGEKGEKCPCLWTIWSGFHMMFQYFFPCTILSTLLTCKLNYRTHLYKQPPWDNETHQFPYVFFVHLSLIWWLQVSNFFKWPAG